MERVKKNGKVFELGNWSVLRCRVDVRRTLAVLNMW